MQSSIATLPDATFSQRFSQLINTFWINSIAPAVIIRHTGPTLARIPLEGIRSIKNTGYIETEHTVLHCNLTWLAVLLSASLTLFLVGLAGAVLSSLRRGPDIIDSFTGHLRDDRYANSVQGSSIEDCVTASKENLEARELR